MSISVLVVTALSAVLVIVLTCVGLSYLSASLGGLWYSKKDLGEVKYYSNPLLAAGSKYFHYKPIGAVIVTKEKWRKIEENMAYLIADAEQKAAEKGYRKALTEIEARVRLAEKKNDKN